ncbi:MAG TPA: hypothetical protein VMQ86_11275 [Bryobacteraceae bacterium]|jgi:DUF4097 and DUF4098 domain-containing protein YvlB|nr:hypothetical protein [Bryobacteraceae bacterium]
MTKLRPAIFVVVIGVSGFGSIALAAEPSLTRDGKYWVEVRSGSEPMAPTARLRINSRGPVTLNGTPGAELSYALKIRVKAASEAEARLLANRFGVRVAKQGANAVYLVVQRGDGMADLQVKLPRTAPETTIATSEGAIAFYDLDGGVQAETGGGAVTADRVKGNIVVRTAGGDITLGTVGGNAKCTTAGGKITASMVHGEATFETGGGDISAQEIQGLVHAATMAGSIRIYNAGSAVIASTGGGPIDVGQAHGVVTARNSGGPVKVGSAEGVSCENAGGGVNLDNISGSVRVSTAVGSIIASLLAGKPMSDSFLSTGSGDITVIIPSNLGVTIRAQNELAGNIRRIISEFPGISVRVEGGQVVAEGPVNGGGPILRISGTGGTIFIKRQR